VLSVKRCFPCGQRSKAEPRHTKKQYQLFALRKPEDAPVLDVVMLIHLRPALARLLIPFLHDYRALLSNISFLVCLALE
jgi:hypothetical protein